MTKLIASNILKYLHLLLLVFMISCLPSQPKTQVAADSGNSTSPTNNGGQTTTPPSKNQLSQKVNFLQLGQDQQTSTLSIFSDYTDSFLIRGNQVIDFLAKETQSSQSNFCLLLKFDGASGSNSKQVLLLSARIRSFYNSQLLNKEYYYQIAPNDSSINQNDCLTVSMQNKISQLYGTSNIAFAIKDLCPSCQTNITSSPLRLFKPTATEVTTLSVSHLFISLLPKIGTSPTGGQVSCQMNANCTAINYNCCLAGQCVNHGQVRSNVSQTSDKYKIALQQIQARPELIKNYTDVFYVCPEMVPTNPDNNQTDPDIDPIQDANDLFSELQGLYNCLNPKQDEFSFCSKKYANASKLMKTAPYIFTVNNDDLNFQNIHPSIGINNISQIKYAGSIYYKEKVLESETAVALKASHGTLSAANDDLTSSQTAQLQIPLPGNAKNDTLELEFRTNGTCKKLGSQLALCKKIYKQGQASSPKRSSDHLSGDYKFKFPTYANTSFNIKVEVGGSPVPPSQDTWVRNGFSIDFNPSEFPIFNNQEVVISYYVTANVEALTLSRELAQVAINKHCACDNDNDCNLAPVVTTINGEAKISSYKCVAPQPDVPDAPLQKTVYVSAKSSPHNFYDKNGVYFDKNKITSTSTQEGSEFTYKDNNFFKPSNQASYVGFNEIYGSFNKSENSPMPATVVDLKKGKRYDLFVSDAALSTCLNCGTDYYNSLKKIFPNSFTHKGGGYLPDMVESRRKDNQGKFRADDLLFGRACFVPATMIPWTHRSNNNVTLQRRNRLTAQHFMFANGYNRDWYGFDYGALIGSFDGITWFAVGNQRRIEAKSNKLFLAINSYFGDLTVNNTFTININETAAVLNSGSSIIHDTKNDGAQCQKAHFCSADEDCISQLGYEYTCQNVSAYRTNWPIFDSNGNETSGLKNVSLLSLVGGAAGQVKRCVYRGRGALCNPKSNTVAADSSYTGSTLPAVHSCSPNTYCAQLSETVFNNKISRYGESVIHQNTKTYITSVVGKTDTFGLKARVLGRPFEFYGKSATPSIAKAQLQNNNAQAMCIPGKAPQNAATTEDLNHAGSNVAKADTILNIGQTFSTSTLMNENYLAACPATDSTGNFTNKVNRSLSSKEHAPYAIRNNLSTNSLNLPVLNSLNLFNDDESPVKTMGYQKNSCLRAPGAKCFTDFECSPNKFISQKIKTISDFLNQMNPAEQDFWEEELVCANSQDRYLENSTYPNPVYQAYEHHCCRETGKSFTFHSQAHEGSSFKVADENGKVLIPGVNQPINSNERYSRTHTIYDKHVESPSEYPLLITPAARPSSPLALTLDKIKQYNTLHLNNSRMCCTGHWVRNFAGATSSGQANHKFTNTLSQNIPISTFKPLSWGPNNDPPVHTYPGGYVARPFTCTTEDYQTSDCEVKNIVEGSAEEAKYLDWFGKFELIGIPQVLIETNDDIALPVDAVNQTDISNNKTPLLNTIKDFRNTGVTDAEYGGKKYYSAASYENFEIGSGKLKKVFSENSFSCCLPTGIEVKSNTPNNACCSGQKSTKGGVSRCCMNDFTDLSVYTNRYVSSEGAFFNGQKISDSDIDPTSGYIRKEIVMNMAATMCCSGKATYGKVINDYFVPINFDERISGDQIKTRRWLYLDNLDNANEVSNGVNLYNVGVKWNNHVYCAPANLGSGGSTGGGGAVQE